MRQKYARTFRNLAMTLSLPATVLSVFGPVLLLSAGCVSVGQSFNATHISDITIGQTSQADIERMFGSPFRTGVEDGDVTWTYLNYRFSLFGKQSTSDLYLRFSADGKVKSYAFNGN